ncbi:MAG: amidohydrolase family protein [Gemmatales bacterium]|nr:amidohydrolase family protein [Gemmatales bacterium]MDW7994799.1 amidohydrolase family protein [Gemmatales bacterium]
MPSIGARWLFDGIEAIYQEALLVWEGERILRVESFRAQHGETYFSDAIILPGLVNAHTHLDLSDLRAAQLPREPLAWLSSVITHRRQADATSVARAMREGMRESLRYGVTLVGDIAGTLGNLEEWRTTALRATVFVEIVGLSKQRARGTWQAARQLLTSWQRPNNVRLGLSPHAPYSTRRSLFALAARSGLPLAIHCLEFAEEHDLLAKRSGPFRMWLESLGAWDERGLMSGYEELLNLTASAPRILFVHVNYPNDALEQTLIHWAGLGRTGIVYCPRTHAFFGHPPHPWLRLLRLGVPVVFGTDSRASNPDLNVLNELRFVWKCGCPLSPKRLLNLVTHTAARLLGWPETGTLCPGQLADFIVMPLNQRPSDDPLSCLLESQEAPLRVYIGGQLVYCTDELS